MVYHCFTDVGIWASLGKTGIMKIAYNFRRDRRTAQLQTKDQLTSTTGSWAKQGIQNSHTTLGDMVGPHNCSLADMSPQPRHDVTSQLRSSAKRKVVNIMITYDVTPQQRLNPSAKRWMAEPANRL